jgi:hypothetical protein
MSSTTPSRIDTALRVLLWGGALGLLVAPLAAMQFTAEVQWSPTDFAVAAVVLGLTAGACEIALRASPHWFYRLGAAVGIGAAFLILWADLAVGFVGDGGARINLVFLAPILVAIAGAAVARLRPAGLVRALIAAAAAQALAALIAIAAGRAPEPPQLLVVTAFFDLLWLTSALLFWTAARNQARTA